MAARFWVPLVVTGCVAGTGGGGTNPRFTVGSTAGLLAGDLVNIATAPGGVTGVSGTMTVSLVNDATHFEVTGTFGGTYTSGGLIGGGRWTSTSTANWGLTTGSTTAGQLAPAAGDAVTFDGLSGGGVVIPAASLNAGPNSIGSLACGAFTGTLDFSVNNPSATLTSAAGFSISGNGTRTINMGSGTFTLNSATVPWTATTTTGLTFNAGTSTLDFTATSGLAQNFGGLAYATVKIESPSPRGSFSIGGSNTFANLVALAPNCIVFPNAGTTTVTTLSITGASAANPVGIMSSSATSISTLNITNAVVLDSCAIRGITFGGAASPFTATNSYDLGQNTNVTVTGPSSGGRGVVGA